MIRRVLRIWCLVVVMVGCGFLPKVVSFLASRRLHSNPLDSARARHLTAKAKDEIFFCESCGTEHIKWMGRCTSCKEWNTIKPFRQARVTSTSLDPRALAQLSSSSTSLAPTTPRTKESPLSTFQSNRWVVGNDFQTNAVLTPMTSISEMGSVERIELFSEEMNRVLGGGLVKGSVVLMAGEPGVGKSTLLLQLASTMTKKQASVVYISGEENPQQIVLRAKRLNLSQDNIFLVCDVDIDKALLSITALPTAELPQMIIVDSIQTMRTVDSTHTLGSVAQIRDSTAKIIQFAKSTGIAVILVGHVTKTGDVAGPRVLEHMVDTVLCIEGSDKTDYRMLRCDKNRFGSVSEVGVFVMTEHGMEDVTNPSEIFLTHDVLQKAQEGSAVSIVMEGSRPILAEIQCLVGRTYTGGNTGGQTVKISAKRTADGFPLQRMLLICAVIEKRLRLSMWSRDVYLNVVGGLRLQEPSADLAVAAAIVSSYLGVSIRPATAFIGEIGLGGELRGGKRIEQRISEAAKLGFRRIVIPRSTGFQNQKKKGAVSKVSSIAGSTGDPTAAPASSAAYSSTSNVEIVPCGSLWEALVAGLHHPDVGSLLNQQSRKKRVGAIYNSWASSNRNDGDIDRTDQRHIDDDNDVVDDNDDDDVFSDDV